MLKKINFVILFTNCFWLSIILASDQQLSKKMGSHVNGERYKGSYKNGLKHGKGTWIHPEGDKYKGRFREGQKRGKGIYTFANGEKYNGYFKRDIQHGLGKYSFNNGETFVGEFKNNIRDGKGYLIFKNDTIKSGMWKKDKFIKKIRLKNVLRHLNTHYPSYKKPKLEPNLSIEAKLSLSNKIGFLETNESAEITIRITNNGKGKAQGIEIFLDIENNPEGLTIDTPDIIQRLNPGESKKFKATIFASDMMITQKVNLSIFLLEQFGYDAKLLEPLSFNTKSLTSPDLVLTDIKINDQNNKNGLIEPAEIIEVTMFVKNQGQQIAKNVEISILYGDYVFNTGKSSFSVGSIKQNQKKKIGFSFFAMSEAEQKLPISFSIKESRTNSDQIIPSGLALIRSKKISN